MYIIKRILWPHKTDIGQEKSQQEQPDKQQIRLPVMPEMRPPKMSKGYGDTEEKRGFIRQLLAEKSDIYVAVHDRKGRNAKELTVESGEKLQVLDRSRNWWKLRNYKGETGYAPYTMLKEYQPKEDFYYERGYTCIDAVQPTR